MEHSRMVLLPGDCPMRWVFNVTSGATVQGGISVVQWNAVNVINTEFMLLEHRLFKTRCMLSFDIIDLF